MQVFYSLMQLRVIISAGLNNCSALYHLGLCYYYGWGAAKDKNKTIELLAKAALQEHINSIKYLNKIGGGF